MKQENQTTSLSDLEKKRYSRHFNLPQVGETGQQLLKRAKVLVVGAGGLGCPVLQYLAAAGVGQIFIIDGDKVSLSNLQRQILFNVDDVGKSKSKVAKEKLSRLNPEIKIEYFEEFFTKDNAIKLVEKVDVVIDGTDNFQTRYLINDACVIADRPFVYGSIHQFSGQFSVFNLKDGQGAHGPTYRCLFPEPPPASAMPSCDEAGVLGALPGILGTLQACETLKIILKLDGIKSGKLVLLDLLGQLSQEIKITPTANSQAIDEIITPEIYCQSQTPLANQNKSGDLNEQSNIVEIDAWDFEELKGRLVIDVRSDWEFDSEIIDSVNIPLVSFEDQEVQNYLLKLTEENPRIVMVCSYGKKSLEAIQLAKGFIPETYSVRLQSLQGGIEGLKRLGML